MMLTNAVSDGERALVQGANDTVIALVTTLAAFAAAAIIAGFGWAILAAVALIILLIAFAIFVRKANPTFVDAAASVKVGLRPDILCAVNKWPLSEHPTSHHLLK